jgi:Arc/MetJ-type ribon-helix-helix transcriptional regulator
VRAPRGYVGTTVTLPVAMVAWLDRQAQETQSSRSVIVRQAVQDLPRKIDGRDGQREEHGDGREREQ